MTRSPRFRCVSFDLDDTLHSYREASESAMRTIYSLLEVRCGIEPILAEQAYRAIVEAQSVNSFTSGLPSQDYRTERFKHLLAGFGVQDDEIIPNLLAAYQESLSRALRPMPGAMDILDHIKTLGLRIVVTTEGPDDAQRWTLDQLGMRRHVDAVFTSTHARLRKNDGLFEHVIERLGMLAHEVIHVGDSYARDVVPARRAGLTPVLFDPDNLSTRSTYDCLVIKRLTGLKPILAGGIGDKQ